MVTAAALALAGCFALAEAARPAGARRTAMPRAFLAICAAGLIALAADEATELHERAGRWLWDEHGLGAPGPVNHVDDLFVLAYAAAGAGLLLRYSRQLLRNPRLLAALSVAAVLLFAAATLDALGDPSGWTSAVEEFFETTGAVALAAAFARWPATPVLVRRLRIAPLGPAQPELEDPARLMHPS